MFETLSGYSELEGTPGDLSSSVSLQDSPEVLSFKDWKTV